MQDLLRTGHPKPIDAAHDAVMAWACGKLNGAKAEHLPKVLRDFGTMSASVGQTPVQRALDGIAAGLPRECLPMEALAEPEVWRALLPQTPIHALIRNLGVTTANGVLADPEMAKLVADKLRNADQLHRSRVHPFAVLLACLVYKTGHGVRGSHTWTPVRAVLDALEDAYDAAFANVTPTGKRILVGVDISGSMTAPCMGTPISAATAASAMALTLARLEPQATVVQFDTAVRNIVTVTKRTGIASIEKADGGGTDVSSPVRWALGDRSERNYYDLSGLPTPTAQSQMFDAFVVLTDNESWVGRGHPAEWLQRYRAQVNPQARLVCCAMASSHANVVDPDDPLSFGVAGLDASVPQLVGEFVGR
jgi:60 kDa SS-A/Ro ribonucleoprotein